MVLFSGKEVAFLFSILPLICRDLIVQLISKKAFDVRQGVNSKGPGGIQEGFFCLLENVFLISKWYTFEKLRWFLFRDPSL